MPERNREARLRKALAEGVRLYNAGSYFEAHEVLEAVWLEEEGEDKAFLQGLIKLAAAFHHFQKGTYKGMLDLLHGGMGPLAPLRPAFRGVELEAYLEEVEAWVPWAERLVRGEDVEVPLSIPALAYDPSPGTDEGEGKADDRRTSGGGGRKAVSREGS